MLPEIAICNLLQRSTRRTDCLGTRTKHFACCLGARTRFLDQRLCRRTRSFAWCLGAKARFLIRCLGTRTSTFVPCGLCMETFTRLWRHAFQIIARLSKQLVEHVLGCTASMKANSQCTSALVKVPESLCQFIEVSRGPCLTHQVWSWHLLLSDSCFQCNSDRGFHVVDASNAQSQNQTRKRVVNTQLGRNRSGIWKILVDCLLHSEHFPAHVISKVQLRQVQQGNGVYLGCRFALDVFIDQQDHPSDLRTWARSAWSTH